MRLGLGRFAMAALGPTIDHDEIRRWARRHNATPTEQLPHVVDGEPAVLRFMFEKQAQDRADVRLITWEEFFLKFDELGLAFVYDEGVTGYNEILQIEEESPYRHHSHRIAKLHN